MMRRNKPNKTVCNNNCEDNLLTKNKEHDEIKKQNK